jgi:hypothetical protein
MANMMKMLKQAQAMQKNMEKTQAELAQRTVEFSAGGGMVTVTAGGDISIRSIKIDPRAVDPDDVEMLEDLVLAGVDGALKAAQDLVNTEMGKLTQGMNLPGLGM